MDYTLYDYTRHDIHYGVLFTDQAIVILFDELNLLTPD